MPIRKQSFCVGEYYHLYNRGVEKRLIFNDDQDWRHFLYLMYVCNTSKNIKVRDLRDDFDRDDLLIDIGAYCLMPNHFHMLVREKTDGGISTYMKKLLTSYSMYFNKKYNRTGRLYENVFKSVYVDKDTYLKYLYSYIHLNPAKLIDKNWRDKGDRNKDEILNYITVYPYSSLTEYLGQQYRIVSPDAFPGYFNKPKDHKDELFEWLDFNTQDFPA